jgi:2-succinyl-5-enolpyruvyl-6-hydroxy-3-cyclohexene-1-carboxylate synthase
MRSKFSNINELWGRLVIEELIRTGVTCFCISSGSRSTPLTLAVSKSERATPVVHFDERGAAYYALGYARATGNPAAVICTSGTAVANFLPAVVEASVDHVPLIVLSADRPPELRDSGANQTVDQVKLFSNFVRWQTDLPCPDDKIAPEFVLTTVDQGVYRSMRTPSGPVHFNFMFREPLAPTADKRDFDEYLTNLKPWMKSARPFTQYKRVKTVVSQESIAEIARLINESKSGIIICGKLNKEESLQVLKTAEKIGWPILPDIGSRLRLAAQSEHVVAYYDQMLLSRAASNVRPDTILHIGGQLVSKRLLQYLDEKRPTNYIRLCDQPGKLDPNLQVTVRIETQVVDFCEKILAILQKKKRNMLLGSFSRYSKIVNDVVTDSFDVDKNGQSGISEPAVSNIITKNISKSGAIFVASSMPVRDMDMFASIDGYSVPVEYNRGASGIDGTIASACGYANGLKTPATLLIGDLAFLHDLNSLALVKKSKYPIVIIVLNNNGSGIFSFLPIAQVGHAFEQFFGTPHGLSFQKSAEQFGISYFHPESTAELTKQFLDAQKKNRPAIIEVTTDRKTNWELHEKISQAVKKALD